MELRNAKILRFLFESRFIIIRVSAITCFDNFGQVLQSLAKLTDCATGFTRQYGGLFIKM